MSRTPNQAADQGAQGVFTTGACVEIERDGQRKAGVVLLASGNQRSLVLRFTGLLGGYLGMMPVLRESDSALYKDLIEGHDVTVTPSKE